MTRLDEHLDTLARWYSEGKLSWESFLICVDVALCASLDGWGREPVARRG